VAPAPPVLATKTLLKSGSALLASVVEESKLETILDRRNGLDKGTKASLNRQATAVSKRLFHICTMTKESNYKSVVIVETSTREDPSLVCLRSLDSVTK
jgi:hypothetical protein